MKIHRNLLIIYFNFGFSIIFSIINPCFSYRFLATLLESKTDNVMLLTFLLSKMYFKNSFNAIEPKPIPVFSGFITNLPMWILSILDLISCIIPTNSSSLKIEKTFSSFSYFVTIKRIRYLVPHPLFLKILTLIIRPFT